MSTPPLSASRRAPEAARTSWLGVAGRAVGIGAVVAILVGALAGGVARVLMRLVAVAAGHTGEFTWGGTLAILLAFIVVALPGAVAAAAIRGQLRWIVPVVGALLFCVPATGIAFEEVGDAALLSTSELVGVVAASVGVYACIAALPVLTVRLVDRWRCRQLPRSG